VASAGSFTAPAIPSITGSPPPLGPLLVEDASRRCWAKPLVVVSAVAAGGAAAAAAAGRKSSLHAAADVARVSIILVLYLSCGDVNVQIAAQPLDGRLLCGC